MKIPRVVLLLLLMFCLAVSSAAAMPERPATDIYVQDNAGLLSQETKDQVLKIGRELDQKTTAQIAVVTVENLDDRPIAEYANELFRKWGIGSKDKNNGVLLLISRNPRKLRIEVGYGLEGALPDGYTGQVRDEALTPNLKKNDYDAGVLAAYKKLAVKTAEEYQQTLDSVEAAPPGESSESGDSDTILMIIVVLVVFGFALIRWFFGGGSGGSGDYFSGGSDGGDSFGGGDSGGGGSDGDY